MGCNAKDDDVNVLWMMKKLNMWMWFRQQTKNFQAAGFETLTQRWDKCVNIGGDYTEK